MTPAIVRNAAGQYKPLVTQQSGFGGGNTPVYPAIGNNPCSCCDQIIAPPDFCKCTCAATRQQLIDRGGILLHTLGGFEDYDCAATKEHTTFGQFNGTYGLRLLDTLYFGTPGDRNNPGRQVYFQEADLTRGRPYDYKEFFLSITGQMNCSGVGEYVEYNATIDVQGFRYPPQLPGEGVWSGWSKTFTSFSHPWTEACTFDVPPSHGQIAKFCLGGQGYMDITYSVAISCNDCTCP